MDFSEEERLLLLKVVEEHLAWTEDWLRRAPPQIPNRPDRERERDALKALLARFGEKP